MYKDGSINISYHNGNLRVEFKDPLKNFSYGKIKATCDGYITFGNDEQSGFEYNEKNKEILWDITSRRDKWIKGFLW